MARIEDVRRQFEAMSSIRDEPPRSTTEARLTPVDGAIGGGYVHEIVTTSSPSRRPGSTERFASVTKRRVVTTGGSDATTSHTAGGGGLKLAPTSEIGARVQQLSFTGGTTSSSRPMPTTASSNGMTMGSSPTPTSSSDWMTTGGSRRSEPTFSPTPVPPSTEPNGVLRSGAARSTSSARSVEFGSVGTTLVEPSRLTPLKVETVYAPVRYLTRRQLRAELEAKQRRTGGDDIGSRLRSSSVPRIDQMQEHRSGSRQRRSSTDRLDEDTYQRLRDEQAMRAGAGPRPAAAMRFFNPSAGTNAPRDDDDVVSTASRRSVDSAGSRRSVGSSGAYTSSSAGGAYRRGASPVRGPIVVRSSSANRPAIPTPTMPLTIHQCAASLAALRSAEPHPAPQHADNAFQLLYRGTYLVKYGRGGRPHERFFSIRVMLDELQRPQLYFISALHAESATINSRLHMAHLAGVARGVASAGYQPHLRGPEAIVGPFVGDKPSTLPTKYAFSLVFRSSAASRTVDLLALDDQTFRCWLLVCDYLAQVNGLQGSAPYQEPEPMLPDTPRSSSSSAH